MKKLICILLVLVTLVVLVSCSDTPETGEPSQTVADNTKYYDAVTRTLKLNRDYTGKSFLEDGIGKATVDAYTDGDTTRFLLESGETVIIRYYSVDTPESTSNIEKWGKAASNFTKKQLQSASVIVLEATQDRATHDSYGTRYLGYVWYKPADETEFKCLNLELVENGFSENKGMDTGDYRYNSYFTKANNFARSIQLRKYSSLDDPLYSTDPIEMTLKDFSTNHDAYYNTDTDSGAKVQFTACLTALYKSESGTYTYTATQFDPETGAEYTIDVYVGYASNNASNMKIGHLYTVVGNIAKHFGKFQVSGISYNELFPNNPSYTKIVRKDYYLAFDSEKAYMPQYSRTLYTDATVKSAVMDGETLVITATAKQRGKDGAIGEDITFTFRVSGGNTLQGKLADGTRIRVSAYQLTENSHEMTVVSVSNIKIIK